MLSAGYSIRCSNGAAFQSGYMRNNKRTGQKNLRCFPACLQSGHNNFQFCGRPVSAVMQFPAGIDVKQCTFFAAFEDTADKKNSQRSKQFSFRVGDRVASAAIAGGCRSPKHQTNPLLKGVSKPGKSARELIVDFNLTGSGWHYSWYVHDSVVPR